MTLRPLRPVNEIALSEGTTSIATSPVAAQVVVPTAGFISRVFASSTGTTTGTITVAVAINGGSDICNSLLTIPAGAGYVGATVELTLVGAGSTSGVIVNEGDTITFTPSGGTGTTIGGAFTAIVRTI